jgi:hypothetical protein
MRFRIMYEGDHNPAQEIVEADGYTVDDNWCVFTKEIPGKGKVEILRLRVARITRIVLVEED